VATDARIMIAISTVRVTVCFDTKWCTRIARILEAFSGICDYAPERRGPLDAILCVQSNRESLDRANAAIESNLIMERASDPQAESLDSTRAFTSRSAQRAAVYLCYAPEDTNAARACALIFESHGTPCWFSDRDMTSDRVWPQCVIEAIESSKFFVLLLSRRAVESADIVPEINEARAAGRMILVLRAQDAPKRRELEALLETAFELPVEDPPSDEDLDAAWRKLVEIETNSTGESVPEPEIDASASPRIESFIVQLECVRGKMSGKLASRLSEGDRLIFGRGSEADVRIEDERASRRHAGLLVERDPKFGLELYLMDLMSRNGTWVRYRREGDPDISKFLEQSQARITNGAIVRIGSTDFRVKVTGVPTPIVSVGR